MLFGSDCARPSCPRPPSTPSRWTFHSYSVGRHLNGRRAVLTARCGRLARRNADQRSELFRLSGPPLRIPSAVMTPEDVEKHGTAEKPAGVDQEAGSLSIRALVTRFMHGPAGAAREV